MKTMLSIPQATLAVEMSIQMNGTTKTVILNLVPDYPAILQIVNRESAIHINMEAVANFAQMFLGIASNAGYDSEKTYAALDPYVKDISYLLDIGVQKVHQAFTLREQLIAWMEAVREIIVHTDDNGRGSIPQTA